MRKRCYLAAAAVVLGLNLAGCFGGDQEAPANTPQAAAEAQEAGDQGDLAESDSKEGSEGSGAEENQAENKASGDENAPVDKETAGEAESADSKKDSDEAEASDSKESSDQTKASEDKETSGGAEAAEDKEDSGQTEVSDGQTALARAADGENKGAASGQEETKVQETEAASQEQKVDETQAAETAAPVKHSGFLFVSQGVIIGMNEDVAPILAGLGAYSNYAESPSCAFKGIDKIYSYSGFDLYTYPINGVDYVNSVYFTDESVSTPEGIHIGSSIDEMTAAYGTGYTEEYGVYTYTNEKSTLSFIVTDGVVETVEYLAITN